MLKYMGGIVCIFMLLFLNIFWFYQMCYSGYIKIFKKKNTSYMDAIVEKKNK